MLLCSHTRFAGSQPWCDFHLPYSDAIDQSLWSPVVDSVEFLEPPPVNLANGRVDKVHLSFFCR